MAKNYETDRNESNYAGKNHGESASRNCGKNSSKNSSGNSSRNFSERSTEIGSLSAPCSLLPVLESACSPLSFLSWHLTMYSLMFASAPPSIGGSSSSPYWRWAGRAWRTRRWWRASLPTCAPSASTTARAKCTAGAWPSASSRGSALRWRRSSTSPFRSLRWC